MTITAQLTALRQMTPAQLRDKYLEVFNEPTRTGNKDFLCKRIAWRIQSLAEGGLSERAKRRAAELARDSDIRMTIPTMSAATGGGAITRKVAGTTLQNDTRIPLPGTILTRRYKGRQIEVTVLPKGFDYKGDSYRSLSAIAKAVTGTNWNGHLFFGLKHDERRASA